jgi:hypothetical protein
MKKFLVMTAAGFFLLTLDGAWAQKEVQPPPVPPMLESPRPLAQPQTKEPPAPKPAEAEKATATKTKAGKTSAKQARAQASGAKKTTSKTNKKQAKKSAKKKRPAAGSQPQVDEGPGEG